MRIAFLGKGGAGKTTTAAGFINYLAKRHPFVLAIDADVNVHLGQYLRISADTEEVALLGDSMKELTQYLRGERSDLGTRPMIASTPPARGSRFIKVGPTDELIKRFSVRDGNIALVTVGKYKEIDVGDACYHTKLNSLATFLHHLLDGPADYVVADTTAGTDNVATTLSFAYDMNVFVIEPTLNSVNVYRDFIGVAPHLVKHTFLIGNKIEGTEDEAFIQQYVAPERYLGSIPSSRNLKLFEQGRTDTLVEFYLEQEPVFNRICKLQQTNSRDWQRYLQLLRETHSRACLGWANSMYEADLLTGLDQSFRYEDHVEQPVQVNVTVGV